MSEGHMVDVAGFTWKASPSIRWVRNVHGQLILQQAVKTSAGDEWDNITLPDGTLPILEEDAAIHCDYCLRKIEGYHPWHGSGLFNGVENPHIHACNECKCKLP